MGRCLVTKTLLNVLDALEDSLKLATIDENWKIRVGRQAELRSKFNAPDLTIRQMGHFQVIHLEGQEITIGAYATDEQLAAEINRIRKTKPKMSSILGTQSLTSTVKANIQAAKDRAQRMAQGNVEALGKVNQAIQVGEQINQSLEDDAADLLKELGQFSNGGPE